MNHILPRTLSNLNREQNTRKPNSSSNNTACFLELEDHKKKKKKKLIIVLSSFKKINKIKHKAQLDKAQHAGKEIRRPELRQKKPVLARSNMIHSRDTM